MGFSYRSSNNGLSFLILLTLLICDSLPPGFCQARTEKVENDSHLQGKQAPHDPHRSENFSGFQATLEKIGWFTPKGVVNGFSMYESKDNKLNLVSMRSCDGYCCEGLVAVQPMEPDQLEAYILFIYAPLENTLRLTNKESVANGFKERVSLLRAQIMSNLQQSDRTEFAFDHLNVRGQCPAVSEAEFKAGKRPELIIKLWIP